MPITAPSLAGFQDFITNVMGIDPAYLPPAAPIIPMMYDAALPLVNLQLAQVAMPPGYANSFYAMAVYNLAGSFLIQFAQDQPGRPYFTPLRDKLDINKFQPGVIASTGDASSSSSFATPEFMNSLTLMDLQNLKDPYGRMYLSLAQAGGWSIVGLS